MTKTITFYELLTMVKNGTAPRKIYVLACGEKQYYVRNGRNYTECNGGGSLLRLLVNYGVSTQSMVDFKCIHCEESVLDEVEKKYLETVLRPFKNKINVIEKMNLVSSDNDCYLRVILGNDNDIMVFPCFKKDKMYTGMSGDKKYTPKDLGLWENAK